MADLILNSLEIQNFRAFKHLTIEKLGRVNLITGRNNVGKTSLLEALEFYASGASPYLILDLLDQHNEMRNIDRSATIQLAGDEEPVLASIRHLFHGRKRIARTSMMATIGPLHSPDTSLKIVVAPYNPMVHKHPDDPAMLSPETTIGDSIYLSEYPPYLSVKTRQQLEYSVPLFRLIAPDFVSFRTSPDHISHLFIKASGFETPNASQLWDKIALTDEENDVICAMRILLDGVQRITFVGETNSPSGRVPMVKLGGQAEPIPLRSLGDGINRVFGLMLALVSARNGFLLIDEVENGLHYSVLPNVWRTLFELAARLNVQVFATTHSWDCITAFQKASQESPETGELIRLRNRDGEVTTLVLDEEELEIAAQERIEVR